MTNIGMKSKFATAAKFVFAVAALQGCLSADALEVHFLRHGETTWNRGKVIQGSIPYTELTPRGVWMARETAKGMAAAGIRYDRIYSSNLLRARRTAEIVAEAQGVKPVADERLREMCMGKYEGVRYANGKYPDDNIKNFLEGIGPYVPTGEGAESMDDVAVRLKSFLDETVRPLDGKVDKILCVTHSFVLKTLVREFAGEGASDAAKKPLQKNCCVHVLEYKDGRFSVKETGRTYYNPENFETVPEPLMVAHRGYGNRSSWRPESSRPAYSNSVSAACDIVKLDLRSTKDGVIVMSHDSSLKRLMNWDVRITNVTYATILEKGRFHIRQGQRLTPTDLKMLRFDEVLEIIRPVPQLWLDFKYFSPEFAEKVVQALRDAKIDFSRVMVVTFNESALSYFKRNYPSIRRISHIFWREFTEPKVYGFLVAGTKRDENGPFRNGKPKGHFKTREKMLEAIVDYIKGLELYGVSLPISNVIDEYATEDDVRFLRKNGVEWVSLWFVQNTKQAETVRSWGVDGFVTDYVKSVRKAYYDIPEEAKK